MKVLLVCLLLAISLAACEQSTPEPTIPQNTPFPILLPTPLPSKGTVTGRIVSKDPTKSALGLSMYFATLLPVSPGTDYLISLDLQASPKAYIYEDGRFVALNVNPGQYALVLWLPHDSRYVPDLNNPKKEMHVNVVSGQILDLGMLSVDLPQ